MQKENQSREGLFIPYPNTRLNARIVNGELDAQRALLIEKKGRMTVLYPASRAVTLESPEFQISGDKAVKSEQIPPWNLTTFRISNN